MSYSIMIRAGNSVIETKKIELAPGENYEERKEIRLPEKVVYR